MNRVLLRSQVIDPTTTRSLAVHERDPEVLEQGACGSRRAHFRNFDSFRHCFK
jgi:hypothetical protein